MIYASPIVGNRCRIRLGSLWNRWRLLWIYLSRQTRRGNEPTIFCEYWTISATKISRIFIRINFRPPRPLGNRCGTLSKRMSSTAGNQRRPTEICFYGCAAEFEPLKDRFMAARPQMISSWICSQSANGQRYSGRVSNTIHCSSRIYVDPGWRMAEEKTEFVN